MPPALSWRLIAAPLYGLTLAHRWLREREQPILQLRLGADTPLPDAADLQLLLAGRPAGCALHLQIDAAGGRSWADLGAFREALGDLRRAGLPIYAELSQAGNAELFLGSVATTLYLHPTVSASLTGLGLSLTFFGALFDRFGLRFDAEAVGSFKSMAESFTRAWPTAASREAMQHLVDGLQSELEAAIAAGRSLPAEEVRRILADAPLSPEDACSCRLVDALAWPDQVDTAIDLLHPGCPRLPLEDALTLRRRLHRLDGWIAGGKRIAILYLRGPIFDGVGPGQSLGGGDFIAATPVIEALRAIRDRADIGALVLHIDSRGGSATASDLIWREVSRIQQDRPVVASMGGVAASGGYYIAAAATEILALPATLTGSIGVVGGKPVIGPALALQGVHTEEIMGAPQADYFSPAHPFRPDQRERFRQSLQRFYDCFLQRVSAGRRRPVGAIEPHAQGRVWTGRQALERGLVDRLGGVEQAVARAAHLANLPLHAPLHIHIAPPGGRISRLIRKNLMGTIRAEIPELQALEKLRGTRALMSAGARGPLALMPFDIES